MREFPMLSGGIWYFPAHWGLVYTHFGDINNSIIALAGSN